MKGNIQKIKKKGKPKTKVEKNLEYIKSVRKADREIALEKGEFHSWIPKTSVHTDKKKKANKNTSRDFKKSKNTNYE